MKPDEPQVPSPPIVSQLRLHGGPFTDRTLQSSWFPKTLIVDGATYELQGFEARYEHVTVTESDAVTDEARDGAMIELRRWAERYEQLAPAARAGYEVATEVLHALECDVVSKLRAAGFEVPEVPTVDDGERRAPRPTALHKRDEVVGHLESLPDLLPDCVTLDVGRIVRLLFDGDGSNGRKATGFAVALRCPALGLVRNVYVLAE